MSANLHTLEEARSEIERNIAAHSAAEQRLVSIAGFAGFNFPLLGGFAGAEILKARNPQDPKLQPREFTEVLGIELLLATYLVALVFLGLAILLALATLGRRRGQVVPGFGPDGILDLLSLESRVRPRQGQGHVGSATIQSEGWRRELTFDLRLSQPEADHDEQPEADQNESGEDSQPLDEQEFQHVLVTAQAALVRELRLRLAVRLGALRYVGRLFGLGLLFTLATVAILVLEL